MSAIAHCPNCAARGLPRPCGSRGILALDVVPELQPRMSGFDLRCGCRALFWGSSPLNWRPHHLFTTLNYIYLRAAYHAHVESRRRFVPHRRRLFAALQLAHLRDVATALRLTAAIVVAISVIEGGGRTYPTPIGSGFGSNSGPDSFLRGVPVTAWTKSWRSSTLKRRFSVSMASRGPGSKCRDRSGRGNPSAIACSTARGPRAGSEPRT
jgi:hypothetical protein